MTVDGTTILILMLILIFRLSYLHVSDSLQVYEHVEFIIHAA